MNTLGENAQLALESILQEPRGEVPSWLLNIMEHAALERLAGAALGDYAREPEQVYLACQRTIGTCLLDQWIPRNPLTMGDHGFVGEARGATTGAERIALDGLLIDSPEAVAAHLERFAFPRLRAEIAAFDEDARAQEILAGERGLQETLGPDILKSGYGFVRFPTLGYGAYGYQPYFTAYALYPELIERHFSLQADLALRHNRAAARAYVEGGLPPLYRLDHDMADSRGTLVDIRSLVRLWFPHFARCLQPLLEARVRLIWHCDGNLMAMVPWLLEVGVRGFQGFQYEDGMDYTRICAMKARDGEPLLIIAGVSVTRTLPFGTPADVRREIDWLVANGPARGLFLGASSSIAPGVPWENLRTLVEGLRYYRAHGRGTA
ncbi:MAG: hypothetical protein GXY76_04940 [Chloroflexi bacterium]|nr:hypothetical protein [Chloroflexota bacterium]